MRIECKLCHHTLRDDGHEGVFGHSGPRAQDCTCTCEMQVLDVIPHRVLRAAKSTKSPSAEPAVQPVEESVAAPAPVAQTDESHNLVAAEPVQLPREPSPQTASPPMEQAVPEPSAEVIDLPVTDVLTMSNSSIRTWKRCPRKWWLAFYRRLHLKKEDPTGARQLGTLVHLALAAHYSTTPQDPLEVLYAAVREDLDKYPEQADDITKQAELAEIMVTGYFEWIADTGADEGLHVVGDEQRIIAEIPTTVDGEWYPVKFQGKIDVRVRREIDDARFFIDHKTVGDLLSHTKMLHMDEQMLSYHLLEQLSPEEGTHAAGGIYNMLRKVKRSIRAKPPFYDRLEVHHNIHELRNFWTRIQGEAAAIIRAMVALDRGEDHQRVAYPNPKRDCTWDCEFLPVCPMFDDGSRAEDLLLQFYEQGDPFAYYGQTEETSNE